MSDLDPTSQINPALAGSAEIADRVQQQVVMSNLDPMAPFGLALAGCTS